MKKYIAAITALGGSYPQYVNFSQDGDEIILTIREKPSETAEHVVEGKTVSIKLHKVLFDLLLKEIQKNYEG